MVASLTRSKIQSLQELAETLSSARRDGCRIVHCHGVFDPLHVGHIKHFQQARQFGDVLVVTVTPDHFVNKGPHRPVFTGTLRAEAIAALECVDYVAVNEWATAVNTIQLLKPAYFVKGSEFETGKDRTGAISVEQEAVESVGGEIAFTHDLTFSASNLVNRHLSVFPPEVSEYLAQFSDRYGADDVLRYLDRAQQLKVLVVGEAIIDEYQYCETMGKSGKEPILASRYLDQERFAGGALAVANHVASFCDNVSLLTYLGRENSHEDFIREHLSPNVDPHFLYLDGAPTIVKRRFVERYPLQKLFEIYEMCDDERAAALTPSLSRQLRGLLPNYDVVIVTDFGHGMMTQPVIDLLGTEAPFLSVNTQMNAANRGFHTISKYPRADYISISESEVRLDARSRIRDLREIAAGLGAKLSCRQLMITRGKSGSVCYDALAGFHEVPALTTQVVDRVGAGDAVLGVTSLCAAQRAPIDVIGLIGNAVGAQAVATVGNQRPVARNELVRYIECLLK